MTFSMKLEPSAPDLKRGGAWFSELRQLDRYLLLVFLGCWLGGIFDGMDSSLMHVVLPVAIRELIHSTAATQVSQVASWVSSIFLVGWMVGGLAFGYIGDRMGRVRAMVVSIIVYSLFTGLGGMAHSWQELAFYRFLTGVGIGGELVSIATFLTEVWPEKSRAVAIGILLTSYQVGVFLAGAIVYWLPDWRQAFFVGAAPALLALVLRLFLKESDRWLEAKEKALTTAEPASQWKALSSPLHRRDVLVGGLCFGGLLVGYWASLAWIPAWIDSFGNAPAQARSIATMSQGLAAIVGCSLSGVWCDWLGRKTGITLAALGALGASVWLFGANPHFSSLVYGGSVALGFTIGLLQASLYVYLPELFPTWLRATGTGSCLNAGRLVTALAVLFVGTFVQWLGGYGQAAMAFSASYLVIALAMTLARETKGKPLEA